MLSVWVSKHVPVHVLLFTLAHVRRDRPVYTARLEHSTYCRLKLTLLQIPVESSLQVFNIMAGV